MRKIALAFLLLISACQQTPQVSESAPSPTVISPPEVELTQRKVTPVSSSANSNAVLISDKDASDFNLVSQFYGQPFRATATQLGVKVAKNEDKFSIEQEGIKLHLETSDSSTITYAQMEFKGLGPCRFDQGVSVSKTMMDAAGLSSTKPIRSNPKTGYVVYRVEGVMVETTCPDEGDYYTLAAFTLK